jgi:hypothetical protein
LIEIKERAYILRYSGSTVSKEPLMDVFQIPFVALFTGMILSFGVVMLYGTINEYRHD